MLRSILRSSLLFGLWSAVAIAQSIQPSSAHLAQAGGVSQALPEQFQVSVTDGSGNPAAGQQVTFTAPASGPTGTFAGGTAVAVVVTDSSGNATAPVFTPGSIVGPTSSFYQVLATSGALSTQFYVANCASGNTVVTSPADSGPGTLRDAVGNACDGSLITFSFPNPSTITLTSGPIINMRQPAQVSTYLPINVSILGPGQGALTVSGGTLLRPFILMDSVTTRPIFLANLTIANGLGKGGSGRDGGGGAAGIGGGLVNLGSLTLANVNFQSNTAVGGNGSNRTTSGAGGGGGGMGGDGLPWRPNVAGGFGGAGGPGAVYGLLDAGGSGGLENTPSQGGSPFYSGGGGGGSQGYAGGSANTFGGGGGAGYGSNASPAGGQGGVYGGGGGGGNPSIPGIYGGAGGTYLGTLSAAGGGGAGLGGAILNLGALHLANVSFLSNTATPGSSGGTGAQDGEAKGGAVANVGPGYFSSYGTPLFQSNVAPGAGTGTACPGVDTSDLCGILNTAPSVANQPPTANDQLNIFAGTSQSTQPGTLFPTALRVRLFNDSPSLFFRANYPITFTLPTSGASGTFPDGSTSATVITNDIGLASAPALLANSTAGAFVVTASIGNLSVTFTLSNGLPPGTTLTAIGGTPQQAGAGQPFASPLQVLVKDANNQPISGASILFTAPTSGASGSFAGRGTATALTDANGIATAPSFTANYSLGTYTVSATAGSTVVLFSLTNALPSGAILAAGSGNGQSVGAGSSFAPLTALLQDSGGHGIQGAVVTFTLPSTGPHALFPGGFITQTATTDVSGAATSPAPVANDILGSFTASASYSQLATSFNLQIVLPGGYSLSSSGSGQTAVTGQSFPSPLQITVLDSSQHGIAGAPVTFSVPASGASGTFAGGLTSITLTTNLVGSVSAPLTANSIPGSFQASASLGSRTVSFNLAAFAPASSSLDITAGNAQSVGLWQQFASQLVVRLRDQSGNGIPGIPITFTLPATGAGALFLSGSNLIAGPAVVATDSNGTATSPFLFANTHAGSYTITATALNLTATFNVTNTGLGSITPIPNRTLTVASGASFAVQVALKQADGTPLQNPGSCTLILSSNLNCYSVAFIEQSGIVAAGFQPDNNGIILANEHAPTSPGNYSVTAQAYLQYYPGLSVSSTSISYRVPASYGFPSAFIYARQTIAPGSGGVPFQVPVVDSASNPVTGALVTFTLPANSPLTFDGSSTVVVTTGADGYAVSPPITFKTGVPVTTGEVSATATVGGLSTSLPVLVQATGSIPASVSLHAAGTATFLAQALGFTLGVAPSTATGRVNIYDNGNPAGTFSLPQKSFTYTFPNAGTHLLIAEYYGDANNGPSYSAPLNISVVDGSSTVFNNVQVVTQSSPNNGGSSSFCQSTYDSGYYGVIYSPCNNLFHTSAIRSTSVARAAVSTASVPALIPYATGPGPHSEVFGDFDGDGTADLLVANQGNNSISFLKSTGSSLSAPVTFPVASKPGPLVAGDFNHDGLLDFACGTADGKIVVGLNTGNAVFTMLPGFAATGSVAALATADLNGDGFIDLVVIDGTTGQVKVFLNDTNGAFVLVASSSQPAYQARAIVSADFNQDGKTDLAIAYYAESAGDASGRGTVAILLGKGDGTFQTPRFLPGGRPVSLATGQFAGHQYLDLVVAYDQSSNIQIFYGNGDGTFQAPIVKSVGTNPSTVLVGDFDGDGRTDVSVASPTDATITYLLGRPPASPATPVIQWLKPGDITAGTPLGAAQLNARALTSSGAPVPGVFTYTPPAGTVLAVGDNRSLSVQFVPADPASYNTVSASQSINVKPVYSAAISFQLSGTALVYPGAANIKVCITRATSAVPTGTVQILDGNTVLKVLSLGGDGCAYWYISPGLNAGTHALQASYSGDPKNPAGISAPVTVTVAPVPVNMGVSCWNVLFPYGADYQCIVNLSSSAGAPQGSITYTYDGGSPASVSLTGGSAQFTITRPTVGTHTVNISYAQQTNYAAATPKGQSFTVLPAPVLVLLNPSAWFIGTGTRLSLQASVVSWSAGPPKSNGNVAFYDGATLLGNVPVDGNGQASFVAPSLSPGLHTIKAVYANGVNYDTFFAVIVITVTS